MQKISKDMIIADLVQIDQNIIPILTYETNETVPNNSSRDDI